MSKLWGASALVFLFGASASAQPTELAPIVTTASRLDQPGYAVGSAVTVIEGEQLAQRQIRFVSDVLRDVPGVSVNRSGGAGGITQVRLRGAEANMTVVLIDGVKVNDPGNDDSVDFANLLAVDVERIEILRGAQSVLWGSGAMGGVINIVTRAGQGKPLVRMNAEGGSHGTSLADASVSGGGARYSYLFGGSRFDTRGISAARGGAEDDPSRNSAIYGRLRFDPFGNFSIGVAGRTAYDTLAFDQPPADTGDTSATRRSWGQINTRLILFDGRLENIAQANLLHIASESYGAFGPGAFEGDKTSLSDQVNLYADSGGPLPLSHRGTFLVEYEKSEGNISFSPSGDLAATRNIGYAGEYGVNYDERVFLTAGLRYDGGSRYDDAVTYRFTAAWRFPSLGTRLHGSYGTGVRNPTLSESFGVPGFTTGNPDLRPERSKSADIGVEQSFFADRLHTDVTLFRNEITDLIAFSIPSSANVSGASTIGGAEFTASARLADALTLEGAYTLMQTQDGTGTELTRRPRNIASLNVNYALSRLGLNFNLGIDYNGRSRDQDFSLFLSPAPYVDLQPYTLVTFAASYALSETVELRGRVENALDQDYEEVKYYGAPGISAFGGIGVKFGG